MRYVIGIDLGTTNSCVTYVDTEQQAHSIQPFRIPQITASGYSEPLPTLPSFCYLTAENEWPLGSLNLPWKKELNSFVGTFALDQGSKVPTRLIQSAKSWLCHSAANRRDRILPPDAAEELGRLSPVEASAKYLSHIKEAWNYSMAQGDPSSEFEQQEIVLTVPASFDEIARSLTVEAAKIAGYINMTLLEEPQAAFYSWISAHETSWQNQFKSGDTILVCDIGGGTTDFSLIEVISQSDTLSFQRMAVGNHLLLGGDNMDAALAHYLEQKIKAEHQIELNTHQWLQLRHEARRAKEALLDPKNASSSYKILLQGTGSSVIAGSLSVDLLQEEAQKLLLEGFFGIYPWNEAVKINRAHGLRTMGLPYEDDPAITKHLASFLNRCANPPKQPDYILFNGGTMKAPAFQKAIISSLQKWFPEKSIETLKSVSLDLAVARGAGYYGKVRRGLGVRIGGGTARGYYLGIEVKKEEEVESKALTLLPRGTEEGASYHSDQTFWLIPNTPVSFQLYTSNTRLEDKSGDLISIDANEMQPLPPIHTVLRYGKQTEKIPVQIEIKLTAIGTLELWLKSEKTDHRWSLEFQLRNALGQDNSLAALDKRRLDETFDASYIEKAKIAIGEIFTGNTVSPKQMMESLEKILEKPRREWSVSILRALADTLLQHSEKRKRSLEYEARWWNLVGFCMRPGIGFPLDDFRVKELWKVILSDLKKPKSLEIEIQNLICYRRISGGLNKGQQLQLTSDILPSILNKKTGKIEVKTKSDLYPYTEKLRTLASFELLDVPSKVKLGNALMERMKEGEDSDSEFWALSRLGARHLVHGAFGNVIPKEIATQWIHNLLALKLETKDQAVMVFGQLARKTDHRELNLSQTVLDTILVCFEQHPQKDHLLQLLMKGEPLTQQEQEFVLGDRLPAGLTSEI